MANANEKTMEEGCGGSSTSKEKNVVTRDDESLYHLLKSDKPKKFRIFRVSAALHELNEHAYSPRVVSIGPLHRGKEHLLAMEERKLSYMHCLFNRTQKDEETKKNCELAMLKMESDARSRYEEEIKVNEINVKKVIGLEVMPVPSGANCDCNTENLKFAKMMLIDGCFIIELLYRHHEKKDRYDSNDPILRNTLLKSTIQDDLLLLENQIPFSVLKKLYDLTVKCIPIAGNLPSLEDCVLSFFDRRIRIINTNPKLEYIKYASQVAEHLLDFSHKIHLGHRSDKNPKKAVEGTEASAIAGFGKGVMVAANCIKGTENPLNLSAMEIHLAGVEFRAQAGEELFVVNFEDWTSAESWYGNLFEICVNKCLVLRCLLFPILCILFLGCLPCGILLECLCDLAVFQITPFSIYDYTELLLRNLIAYEQCCPDIYSYFTSHAIFMDTLINSEKDVELLEKAKVIQNHLGCSDEAAKLFNNLCKHIVVDNDNFYIDGLSKVEAHCSRSWPRYIKRLRGDYFGSPWSGIAVIAAFIIFILTLLQTIYAMK